ncbi:hypothetical protein [Pseudaestuariivita sp.]|uniref:hypothetical protein n=1 Tax=Pseudaestuariivita sp. TaxID=2211669 RepID=UPI0040597764
MDTVWTHLLATPWPAHVPWGALGFTALLAICGLGLLAGPARGWQKAMGLERVPTFAFLVLGLLYAVLSLVLIASLIWLVGKVAFTFDPDINESKFRFVIAQLVAVTAVTGAVVTLPISLARLEELRKQNRISEQTAVTNQLLDAMSHFASESAAVRMGAIHALERLMKQYPSDRPMVLKTLNAYVLDQARNPRAGEDEGYTSSPMPIDLQAAIDVLLKGNEEATHE